MNSLPKPIIGPHHSCTLELLVRECPTTTPLVPSLFSLPYVLYATGTSTSTKPDSNVK